MCYDTIDGWQKENRLKMWYNVKWPNKPYQQKCKIWVAREIWRKEPEKSYGQKSPTASPFAVNKEKANKMLRSIRKWYPKENTFISFDNTIAYTTNNDKQNVDIFSLKKRFALCGIKHHLTKQTLLYYTKSSDAKRMI